MMIDNQVRKIFFKKTLNRKEDNIPYILRRKGKTRLSCHMKRSSDLHSVKSRNERQMYITVNFSSSLLDDIRLKIQVVYKSLN